MQQDAREFNQFLLYDSLFFYTLKSDLKDLEINQYGYLWGILEI